MVDVVAPARNLTVVWQPISLLVKNAPAPDSEYYAPVAATHSMLRVMEAARADHGDDAAFRVYWHLATRIHHDRLLDGGVEGIDLGAELTAIGLEAALAAAADDVTWDDEIARRMQRGLDLVGTDVGTPIIAFDTPTGERCGVFGPVTTAVPGQEDSLAMWDAVVTLAGTDGFWELKRTRTRRPEFGNRPA